MLRLVTSQKLFTVDSIVGTESGLVQTLIEIGNNNNDSY